MHGQQNIKKIPNLICKKRCKFSNTYWIFVQAHNRLFAHFGEYPPAE